MKNFHHLMIPISIIVAGMIIGSFSASAIIYVGKSGGSNATRNVETGVAAIQGSQIEVRNTKHAEVTENDRILGSLNAQVKLIDYSDTECPFCKRHHQMLEQLFKGYDKNDVAWVYRHLPLDFHIQALPEAVATECVAKIAGEDAFWTFLGRIYQETTSNDGLDLDLLPKFAEESGVTDMGAYNNCYTNQDTLEKVEFDMADAASAGGSGTPYSRLVSSNKIDEETRGVISDYLTASKMQDYVHFSEDGYAIGISGALPEATFRTLIDELLAIN